MRVLLLASVVALGCSSSGKSSSSTFTAPAVTPIVRDATPAALRPDAMALRVAPLRNLLALLSPIGRAHADTPTVDSAIRGIFKDTFDVEGTPAQGKINSALLELDGRVSKVEKIINEGAGAWPCADAAATSHRIDLTSFSTALDLTVNVQCTFPFNMPAGVGAGLVFGKSGDAYSMWLNAGGAEGTGGFVANVLHSGQPDKSVDFLSLDFEANVLSPGAYRVKAQPSTNSFELVCAGDCSSANAGIGGLDCGFQLISDGNFIWATGSFAPMGDCSTATPFANCYSASDLSLQTTGCETLKTSFTMPLLTSASLANSASAFNAALALSTATSP